MLDLDNLTGEKGTVNSPKRQTIIFFDEQRGGGGLAKIMVPLNGQLVIKDSLLCPWGKKALTFSRKSSTRLIWTPS